MLVYELYHFGIWIRCDRLIDYGSLKSFRHNFIGDNDRITGSHPLCMLWLAKDVAQGYKGRKTMCIHVDS